LGYISEKVTEFYDDYLREPLEYFWNDIIIDLIWNNFVNALEHMKNGESPIFDSAAQEQANFISTGME